MTSPRNSRSLYGEAAWAAIGALDDLYAQAAAADAASGTMVAVREDIDTLEASSSRLEPGLLPGFIVPRYSSLLMSLTT